MFFIKAGVCYVWVEIKILVLSNERFSDMQHFYQVSPMDTHIHTHTPCSITSQTPACIGEQAWWCMQSCGFLCTLVVLSTWNSRNCDQSSHFSSSNVWCLCPLSHCKQNFFVILLLLKVWLSIGCPPWPQSNTSFVDFSLSVFCKTVSWTSETHRCLCAVCPPPLGLLSSFDHWLTETCY